MLRPSAPTTIEQLRSVPLFANLSDHSLEHIAQVAKEFVAEPSLVLVQPNREATGMFITEEGNVTVEMHGKTVELGPGEFFGETALLNEGALRTARVQAKTAVRCLAIYRRDFDELLEAEPKIAVGMLRVLARRLADTI